MGLVGPNGSGKNTLFKILSLQIKRSGGQVYFRGESIDALTKLVNVGIVFQHNDVFWPEDTVL